MIALRTWPISMWTPITAISSGCYQLLRAGVWLKSRPRTASPVPSWIADWSSCSQKFARYWRSLSAPIRKKSQVRRRGRIGLTRDGAVAPNREVPDDPDEDRADDDPEDLRAEPDQELLG